MNAPAMKPMLAPRTSPTAATGNILGRLKRGRSNSPSKMVLHGTYGVGKTSWAAHAPKPVFIESPLETGVQDLVDAGLVPDVPHFRVSNWIEWLSAIDELTKSDHNFKTLVVDTMSGMNVLLADHVKATSFKGRDQEFNAWGKGEAASLPGWREMLVKLERLRESKGMGMLLLCQTTTARFKNPEGPDYDEYVPLMMRDHWAALFGWSSIVLFAKPTSFTVEEGGKVKGKGGTDRVCHTQGEAAFAAKERAGMDPLFDFGPDGETAWANTLEQIKKGRRAQGDK